MPGAWTSNVSVYTRVLRYLYFLWGPFLRDRTSVILLQLYTRLVTLVRANVFVLFCLLFIGMTPYWECTSSSLRCFLSWTEPVFVNLLRSPGIDSKPWRAGTTTLFVLLARPPGYIDWRNRFFGIDSWAPKTFTNTGSDQCQAEIEPGPAGRRTNHWATSHQISIVGLLVYVVPLLCSNVQYSCGCFTQTYFILSYLSINTVEWTALLYDDIS